jgi:redox-sensing transcriptional repressor
VKKISQGLDAGKFDARMNGVNVRNISNCALPAIPALRGADLAGKENTRLRRVVLERLMRYYRWLTESAGKKLKTVTSAQIAEALDIDPTQVRKDFGAIGILGMGRVGFEVCEVCRAIRFVLGFDQQYEAIVVGAGHLGSALAAYKGFASYGLDIVAVFDNDQQKIGSKVAGHPIKPMRGLKPFIRRHDIQLAILTTPAAVSQKLTDRLVSAGIKAIWNFTPTRVTVPPDVFVRNEHISLGLSEIAYHLTH